MKLKFAICLFVPTTMIFCISYGCQSDAIHQVSNLLDKNEIKLKEKDKLNDTLKCDDIVVNGVKLFSTIDEVKRKLGKPDSTYTETDEESTPTLTFRVLLYQTSEFSFENENLVAFFVSDTSFIVNNVMSVGDSIQKVQRQYSMYFNYEKTNSGISIDILGHCTSFPKHPCPRYLLIRYDADNKITQIITPKPL